MPPRRTPSAEPTTHLSPLPVDPTIVSLPTLDDEDLEQEQEEVSTPNLAEAIVLMTSELRQRGKDNPTPGPKVKEPDTFDGTDSRKLNNFLLLCNLYFRSNPTRYDDSSKVTFALSYLRGLALEFFEPTLLDSDEAPEWLEDWNTFVGLLRQQFGPIDPSADAEDSIDNLKMRDGQHIVKYNVEFNRLAIRTGWDNNVLRHRYYSGLADRIKDNMGYHGKPSTLDEMKRLAHSIDSRHWERQREKSRSEKSHPTKSDKSPSTNNSDNSSKKDSSSTNTSNKPSKPAASTSSAPKPVDPDKLKDGKLTTQERQRRMDNNLCMYCGEVGHKAQACTKSAKAKGRSAQVVETPAATTPAAVTPTSGKD